MSYTEGYTERTDNRGYKYLETYDGKRVDLALRHIATREIKPDPFLV